MYLVPEISDASFGEIEITLDYIQNCLALGSILRPRRLRFGFSLSKRADHMRNVGRRISIAPNIFALQPRFHLLPLISRDHAVPIIISLIQAKNTTSTTYLLEIVHADKTAHIVQLPYAVKPKRVPAIASDNDQTQEFK